MAGVAFRTGEFVSCPDVDADERFAANPNATRSFKSLISIPLRIGTEVVGTFNVVSTYEDAFDEADMAFIRVVGSVLDVVLASEKDAIRWEAYAEAQKGADEGEDPEIEGEDDA
jgi:GAF domain-containing protein